MTRGYDEKCLDLAQYFLADVAHPPVDEAELAQAIQDAIENWFTGKGYPYEQ